MTRQDWTYLGPVSLQLRYNTHLFKICMYVSLRLSRDWKQTGNDQVTIVAILIIIGGILFLLAGIGTITIGALFFQEISSDWLFIAK